LDRYTFQYRVQIHILCFVLCLCYFSCKEVKAPEKSFDTKLLSKHEVEFLNSTLWLPPNYEKLTYDALFEIAKVTDDALVNMLLQSAKEYRDQEKKPVFFRDEFVPNNFIALYPRLYILLNKTAASYYISDFATRMKREDQQYGRTSEIVEKRIKSFGGHKMVKLKVKQTFAFSDNRHFMQYFISSSIRSFMVIHIDVINSDYEANFKELSLGSD
jgi:hypothetical protein